MGKVDEVLHHLLGEWGARSAFEREQVAKAKADLKALFEGIVEDVLGHSVLASDRSIRAELRHKINAEFGDEED